MKLLQNHSKTHLINHTPNLLSADIFVMFSSLLTGGTVLPHQPYQLLIQGLPEPLKLVARLSNGLHAVQVTLRIPLVVKLGHLWDEIE